MQRLTKILICALFCGDKPAVTALTKANIEGGE